GSQEVPGLQGFKPQYKDSAPHARWAVNPMCSVCNPSSKRLNALTFAHKFRTAPNCLLTQKRKRSARAGLSIRCKIPSPKSLLHGLKANVLAIVGLGNCLCCIVS